LPPSLPPGSSLRSRYKIVRVLHQSQLRNLYIAEDQHLRGKFWVVKEMQPVGVDPGERSRLLARFQAEALQISALEHRNLPKVVDFFAQDSLLYVIREFVQGTDLETALRSRGGPLSEREALKIAIQLTDLMSFLWNKKLPPGVFRDMRLSSLMVTGEGQLKLVDLGFARLFGSDFMGAPDYAAPEQFAAEGSTDARTLVYNAGALLYHLLTGKNPGSSGFDLPPVGQLRPGLSSSTQAAVERAVRIDPRERFANPAELRRALERALARPPGAGAPPRPAAPLPAALGTWLLALLLLAAMAGGLLAIYRWFLAP
jgi:serine/threonine-protein kinase